jgi:ribosome biogenesis GTPase
MNKTLGKSMLQIQYSLHKLGWKPYFNQQLTLEDLEHYSPARVTRVFRNRLVALGENGEQNISLAQNIELNCATIGDWVLVPNSNSHAPKLLERLSLFQRKSPGSNSAQTIAANVDTAFIVTSFNQDFNVSRIERYLALAKEADVSPVLVVTKLDQITEEQQEHYLEQLHEIKKHMLVVAVNALEQESCTRLDDWCDTGQTVVLLGSSGVGKTTLTNTLCAVLERTAHIREDDSKGRHTTTERTLFFTQAGGMVLDCPGMRELQLTDCEEGVKAVFSDIADMAADCKFVNCQHQQEPSCKIRAAINNGMLDERRLVNFQKMSKEQARNSLTIAESHQQDKKLGKLIKSAQSAKRNKYDN